MFKEKKFKNEINLSNDVLIFILEFLPVFYLLKLEVISKEFQKLILKNDYIWLKLFKLSFKDKPVDFRVKNKSWKFQFKFTYEHNSTQAIEYNNKHYNFKTIESTFKKQKVCSLRVDDYIIIDKKPCLICNTKINTYDKKNRSATYKIVAQVLFSNKLKTKQFKLSDLVNVPILKYTEYELIDIDEDGYLTLINLETDEEKIDYKLPKGIMCNEIINKFDLGDCINIKLVKVMNIEELINYKIIKN